MNADRFLNAIVEIEGLLKVEAKLDPENLADLNTLIANSRLLGKANKDKLHKWRRLRNAIVHNTTFGSKPIADPRDSEVAEIEKLVEILKNPPKAAKVLNLVPPKVLDWDSEISEFFVELMPPKDFSQAPFRDRNGEYRLITSNAVARWAAAAYEQSSGAIMETSIIEAVAEYCEEGDRLLCARIDLSAQRTIDLLTSPEGVPPAAVLLTDTGHHSGDALGLAVRADLPTLYRAVSL